MFTMLDVEKFCRDNWENVKKKDIEGDINLDYSDGIKDTLREIIDTYFGGVK